MLNDDHQNIYNYKLNTNIQNRNRTHMRVWNKFNSKADFNVVGKAEGLIDHAIPHLPPPIS
jgi:hypothetical protein